MISEKIFYIIKVYDDWRTSDDGKSTRDTLGLIRHIVRAIHEHSVEETSQYNYGHKKDKILQFFLFAILT